MMVNDWKLSIYTPIYICIMLIDRRMWYSIQLIEETHPEQYGCIDIMQRIDAIISDAWIEQP